MSRAVVVLLILYAYFGLSVFNFLAIQALFELCGYEFSGIVKYFSAFISTMIGVFAIEHTRGGKFFK